jgi:sec-independent protein translocase protein TatB
MLNVGPQELLIILLIALIVVGPQKLPELSRQIGRGLREFKRVQDEVKDMVKLDLLSEPEPPRPTPTAAATAPAAPAGPGVHRTPRPVPVAPVEDVTSPGVADATSAEPHGPATAEDGPTPSAG